jgi:membrane protein
VAGSLILILIWIYYSAQIFFFGAEFTQVYANRFGKKILPSKKAVWKTESESASENRDEAQDATGSRPQEAVPAKGARPKPGRPAREKHPRPAPASAAQPGWQTLHEMANRIQSWHSMRHS